MYLRSLAITEKSLGPAHPDVASGLNNLAELDRQEKKYAEAESLYKRALEIREKALGPDHPDVAQSLENLAGVLILKSKEINVDSFYLRALAIRKKVFGPESHQAVASLNDLGVAYAEEGKFPEAEQTLGEAVALLLPKSKQDAATLEIVYTNMSNLFNMEGKHRKARKMAERAKACHDQEGSPS